MTPTIAREVTEWYPAEDKPAHVGIYEVQREYTDGSQMPIHKLMWTGKRWEYPRRWRLARKGDFASMTRGDYWRGLRSPA